MFFIIENEVCKDFLIHHSENEIKKEYISDISNLLIVIEGIFLCLESNFVKINYINIVICLFVSAFNAQIS